MQLKFILNQVQKFKGFVYQSFEWNQDAGKPIIDIRVVPRSNSRARCGKCKCPSPGYENQPDQRFQFIPFWGIKVFFIYAPCLVNCKQFGVRFEWFP